MKLFHHPFSGWNTEHEMKIVRETTPNRELPANSKWNQVCVCRNQEQGKEMNSGFSFGRELRS